jgi:putative ABC transport system substrate-binding protein
MQRREFITLLGGAAAASSVSWPLTARAQQRAMPVVGLLQSTTATVFVYRVAAFRQGLAEAGFVEGRNVAIEFRYGEGRLDALPGLASDLVRRGVSAIVTNGASLPAAKAATSTIPIVFVGGADPVEAGYVTNLSRPDGNVTGVSFVANTLEPKRLELLHELVAKTAVVAVLLDPSTSTYEAQSKDITAAARALGRQIVIVKSGKQSEIDAAFATIVQAGAGALFVGTSAFFNGARRELVARAASHALPVSYELREYVEAGGLMSYGASSVDAYRRGGNYVGRILKGEKPGDLPVELPTRYELVFNLATAKALGLEIPAKLLALSDEVLE